MEEPQVIPKADLAPPLSLQMGDWGGPCLMVFVWGSHSPWSQDAERGLWVQVAREPLCVLLGDFSTERGGFQRLLL